MAPSLATFSGETLFGSILNLSHVDAGDSVTLKPRISAVFVILSVSLFAVSFPGVSKQIPFLRIPHVVFFIGKHFGTGVILSTAFCHLLQDAFESLQDPLAKERWDLSRWTGLIILGSLLSIFLVEYISTSYVDRLQADSSAPPSLQASRSSSPQPIAVLLREAESSSATPSPNLKQTLPLRPSPPRSPLESQPQSSTSNHTSVPHQTERTPLIAQASSHTHTRSHSYGDNGVPPRRQRSHSLSDSPPLHSFSHPPSNPKYLTIFGDRDHHRCFCKHDEYCGRSRGRETVRGKKTGKKSVIGIFAPQPAGNGDSQGRRHGHSHDLNFDPHASDDEGHPSGEEEGDDSGVSRRRRVIGILVLQLGIMIHSFVIGLTLAITSASDFASLLTAIIFHQLFEGLSLGIRIAALPPPPTKSFRIPILGPTLSILFAVTTPIGILIGLFAFTSGDGAQMKLVQGLMSAISAGMLIYASCVEMLAGDFVMDPHMHMGSGGVGRQVVALASLLLGVVGMALVD